VMEGFDWVLLCMIWNVSLGALLYFYLTFSYLLFRFITIVLMKS
jgi:hypothetical protein